MTEITRNFENVEMIVFLATLDGAKLIEQLKDLLQLDVDLLEEEDVIRYFVLISTTATEDLNEASDLIDIYHQEISDLLVSSTAKETDKQRSVDKLKRQEEKCLRKLNEAREDAEEAAENLEKAEKEYEETESELEKAKKQNQEHQENAENAYFGGTISGLLGVAGGVTALLIAPLIIPGAVVLAAGAGGMVGGYTAAVINKIQIKSEEEMNRLRSNVADANEEKKKKQESVEEADERLEDCLLNLYLKEGELEECQKTIAVLKEQLRKLAIYKQHVVGMKNLVNQIEPEVEGLMKNLEYFLEQSEIGIRNTKRMVENSLKSLQEALTSPDPALVLLQAIGYANFEQEDFIHLLINNVQLPAIL